MQLAAEMAMAQCHKQRTIARIIQHKRHRSRQKRRLADLRPSAALISVALISRPLIITKQPLAGADP